MPSALPLASGFASASGYSSARNSLSHSLPTDRRQGAMVARNITMNKEFREKLESELELLSAEASINGMDKSEFMKMCESIYSTMNPQPLQA